MDRKKARLLIGGSAVVLVLVIAACLFWGTSPTKIGICVYDASDAMELAYAHTLEAMLTEQGYEVSLADGKNDQTLQLQQIDAFIKEECDALVVNPVMTFAADQIIERVKQANIPAVFVNREPGTEAMTIWDRASYVGSDAGLLGTLQGQMILQTPDRGDINGDGVVSYLMIQGMPVSLDTKIRTENAIKALEDAGVSVNALKIISADGDRGKSSQMCAGSLSEFGKDIEVVFCNDDAMALGALQAIEDGGRQVGKDIYLVGIGGEIEALNSISTGDMTGTVMADIQGLSQKTAEVLGQLLDGQTPPQKNYVNQRIVTAENVSQYMYIDE